MSWPACLSQRAHHSPPIVLPCSSISPVRFAPSHPPRLVLTQTLPSGRPVAQVNVAWPRAVAGGPRADQGPQGRGAAQQGDQDGRQVLLCTGFGLHWLWAAACWAMAAEEAGAAQHGHPDAGMGLLPCCPRSSSLSLPLAACCCPRLTAPPYSGCPPPLQTRRSGSWGGAPRRARPTGAGS